MKFVKTTLGSAAALIWLFAIAAAFAAVGPLIHQGLGWAALASFAFGLLAFGLACAAADRFING